MPKNTNILLIRHAEKPQGHDDPYLSPLGKERAEAYVAYFQKYSINSKVLKLNYLFAAADSSDSHRPRLTITPLAGALGLLIDSMYPDNEYQALAKMFWSTSKYDESNILICWHHGKAFQLAQALGVMGLPPKWPEDVFGWLLQLSYDSSGNLIPSQTMCINENLMPDDRGQIPPNI